MASTKSFDISKHVVWEAYKRVRANKGAAGVDNESLTRFEQHLKGNLFKVWNRMSSGSCFPLRRGRAPGLQPRTQIVYSQRLCGACTSFSAGFSSAWAPWV